MPYLTETQVRRAARSDMRVIAKNFDSSAVLRESARAAPLASGFDVFLCHSISDADLVQGAKKILEDQGLTVYVDWIVDPQMDRSAVNSETAEILRNRMQKSKSLLYLYSRNSKRSRWMPWELGYFDGYNGTVGVLPIVPDTGVIDFSQEEYLGLYPKVELSNSALFVNRTKGAPVKETDRANYRSYRNWVTGNEKLRF